MATASKEQKLKIDYNRGVIINQDNLSGMNVYMYVDTPGVYLNAFEHPVSDEIAARAGFKVEALGKLKLRNDRLAAAQAQIEQELNMADIENKREIVSEKDGFKVINIGLDRFNVEDPDGNRLNTVPLPQSLATQLMDNLTSQKSTT